MIALFLLAGALHGVPAPVTLGPQASPSPSVTLSWGFTQGADPAVGFQIQRTPTGAGQWRLIDTVDVDTLTYTDTTVVEGYSYNYRVKAVDQYGILSAPSNTVVEDVVPTPAAPFGLTGAIN